MLKRLGCIVLFVLCCMLIINTAKANLPDVGNTLPIGAFGVVSGIQPKDYYFEKSMAYVVFTFDDGCLSDYALAYPLFKQLGIHGTSYIIGGRPDTNRKDAMSWEMIKEMYASGWDFGCHTYAHSNENLMTAENIAESMRKENEAFMRNGLPIPISHAFPYGKYNAKVIAAIEPYRTLTRKAYYDDTMKKPGQLNPYELDSVSADFRGEKRLEERIRLVDKAVKEKDVLIFRTHCLFRKSPNDMGNYAVQTDFTLYKRLVEYVCAQPNVRVITMAQLSVILQNGYMP